jgi:hypothetical protein
VTKVRVLALSLLLHGIVVGWLVLQLTRPTGMAWQLAMILAGVAVGVLGVIHGARYRRPEPLAYIAGLLIAAAGGIAVWLWLDWAHRYPVETPPSVGTYVRTVVFSGGNVLWLVVPLIWLVAASVVGSIVGERMSRGGTGDRVSART